MEPPRCRPPPATPQIHFFNNLLHHSPWELQTSKLISCYPWIFYIPHEINHHLLLALLSKYCRCNIQALFNISNITTVLICCWRKHHLFPDGCSGLLNCLTASILAHLVSVLKIIVVCQNIINILSFICSKSSHSL